MYKRQWEPWKQKGVTKGEFGKNWTFDRVPWS